MIYLLLAAAITSEIIGALATRFSDGFSKPWPTLLAITGIIGAYYLLSLVLGARHVNWRGLRHLGFFRRRLSGLNWHRFSRR